jgi:hypothetical protein
MFESSVFWDIIPCSPTDVSVGHLHLQNRISSVTNQDEAANKQNSAFIAYSSTLKMEAICSTGTSVDFHRTTWRYIPENRTLHIHLCGNLIQHGSISFSSLRLTRPLRNRWQMKTWVPHLRFLDIISKEMQRNHGRRQSFCRRGLCDVKLAFMPFKIFFYILLFVLRIE